MQSALDKLEQLYPEHKIFALDALDKDLQDKLNKLAHNAGLDCAISEHIYYHNGLIVMVVNIE